MFEYAIPNCVGNNMFFLYKGVSMHNKKALAGSLACMLLLSGTQVYAFGEVISDTLKNIASSSAGQWTLTVGKWTTYTIIALVVRDKISECGPMHKVPVIKYALSKRALVKRRGQIPIANVAGLQAALDAKKETVAVADVDGLEDALDAKQSVGQIAIDSVTDLRTYLEMVKGLGEDNDKGLKAIAQRIKPVEGAD